MSIHYTVTEQLLDAQRRDNIAEEASWASISSELDLCTHEFPNLEIPQAQVSPNGGFTLTNSKGQESTAFDRLRYDSSTKDLLGISAADALVSGTLCYPVWSSTKGLITVPYSEIFQRALWAERKVVLDFLQTNYPDRGYALPQVWHNTYIRLVRTQNSDQVPFGPLTSKLRIENGEVVGTGSRYDGRVVLVDKNGIEAPLQFGIDEKGCNLLARFFRKKK